MEKVCCTQVIISYSFGLTVMITAGSNDEDLNVQFCSGHVVRKTLIILNKQTAQVVSNFFFFNSSEKLES